MRSTKGGAGIRWASSFDPRDLGSKMFNHGAHRMARKESRNDEQARTIGVAPVAGCNTHLTEAEGLQFKNRRGVVYYLQEGKTPTGKPKYYAGKKLTGTPMAAMPSGYEFYERPDNAQVVLRKAKRSSITESERKEVEDIFRRVSGMKHFMVEIDGDALVVHTSAAKLDGAEGVMNAILGPLFSGDSALADKFAEVLVNQMPYEKVLRFELVGPEKREFCVKKWSSDDSIDGWIEWPGADRWQNWSNFTRGRAGKRASLN